jgi:guanylate kinase
MSKGLLIVLSAPSGSGKSTVREALMKKADFAYSVSATTRAPRDGESDGVDYWFVTREQFEEKIKNGEIPEERNLLISLASKTKLHTPTVLMSARNCPNTSATKSAKKDTVTSP